MEVNRRKVLTLSLGTLFGLPLLCFTAPESWATEWPDRPIQYVVPYAPGGGADASARIFTVGLSKELGVPVAVVNVPGVSATLGLNQVVEAKPDGYTIGAFHEGAQATYVTGISKHNLSKLDMVCNVYMYPNLLVSRADAPWNSIVELNKIAKEKPEQVKFALVLGTSTYMYVLQYMDAAGVKFKLVPYNGHAERINAVLGGYADVTESPPSSVASMLRAKKFKALGMLTEQRYKDFPDLPTSAEQGIPVQYTSNYALFAPKGTPAAILAKLDKASQAVLKDPEIASKLDAAGTPGLYVSGPEMRKRMDGVLKAYIRVGEKFGVAKNK